MFEDLSEFVHDNIGRVLYLPKSKLPDNQDDVTHIGYHYECCMSKRPEGHNGGWLLSVTAVSQVDWDTDIDLRHRILEQSGLPRAEWDSFDTQMFMFLDPWDAWEALTLIVNALPSLLNREDEDAWEEFMLSANIALDRLDMIGNHLNDEGYHILEDYTGAGGNVLWATFTPHTITPEAIKYTRIGNVGGAIGTTPDKHINALHSLFWPSGVNVLVMIKPWPLNVIPPRNYIVGPGHSDALDYSLPNKLGFPGWYQMIRDKLQNNYSSDYTVVDLREIKHDKDTCPICRQRKVEAVSHVEAKVSQFVEETYEKVLEEVRL